MKDGLNTYASGNKRWFVDGKKHRADGPAIEYANGDKRWYLRDKLHRTDGPAVEYTDGDKRWYVEGIDYHNLLVAFGVIS